MTRFFGGLPSPRLKAEPLGVARGTPLTPPQVALNPPLLRGLRGAVSCAYAARASHALAMMMGRLADDCNQRRLLKWLGNAAVEVCICVCGNKGA